MCLSWSNSPFPMCLCLCKADKFWLLFSRNQSETHFVLGLYSSSSSSKSLTRAWKWDELREWALYVFFRIWLTPCSMIALWVARKLSKWTCADRDILCRAPVAIFLSPEKIRFRHLQSANISNPQTKICSLIARKTYTRKVNITAIPDISGWPFETHEKVRFSSWNQPSKSFVLEEYPSIPSA